MLRQKIPVFISVLLLCFWAAFPLSSSALEIEAISAPSVDIELSFVMTGRISRMLVKEGDIVNKGDLLCSLDDRTETIRVMELQAAAEDTIKLAAVAAELDQKRVDLEKFESAHAKGAVAKWELEHAKLDMQIAELGLRAAELEHEQNRRRLEQAVSQIERMRLISPVSGRIEKVLVTAGESVKALDPIIQLIRVDPLWIDTPVPVGRVREFALGQRVLVQFPLDQSRAKTTGRIIHISSVVDAASETLQIRLEVPNPKGRPAGERITVQLGEDEPPKQQTKKPLVDTSSKDLTITSPANDKMQRP